MIEERALVARIEAGEVWVRPWGPESCPRCAEGRGCGGGVLGRLVARRRPEIRVGGGLPGLKPGDTVIIGVDEGSVLRASLWVYLVPLAGMLLAGLFAQLVLAAHDVLVAAFGLAGLAGGFVLTRRAGQQEAMAARCHLALLRRAEDAPETCARTARL